MHSFPRTSLALVAIPLALALSATAGCTRVIVTPSTVEARTDTITVSGRGEVSRAPDIAHTTLGVEMTAPTVQEATRLANSRMNEVLSALEKVGVAKKDIQTTSLNIGFERTYPPPPPPVPLAAPTTRATPKGAPSTEPAPEAPQPAQPAGFYRVTNMVQVTIRDLTKLGPVLDAAVSAGANAAYGVSFGIDDPKALEAEARAKAMEHAHAQAEQLAKLAGHSLGDVVSIGEEFGGGPIRPMMMAKVAMAESYGGTPVSAGEVSVSSQVQVVYRIEKK